ncbi:MAG: hypothetical protein JF614_30825 [Acidobacteria bacterium]|nr:hypothetical protein [Acidobacteriota bacterium]
MANYTWQLGIDWNAVETAGVSYLREGLFQGDAPSAGTHPVQNGDNITFQIFDVCSPVPPATAPPGRQVDAIRSFVILTKAAVNGQPNCNSLSTLQPAVVTQNSSPGQQSLFGAASCSWTSEPAQVQATSKRFLLTIQVQAIGLDGTVRFFSHDPEMAVGPFG